MKLELRRIPGEDRRELVLLQTWGAWQFWIKHEYPAAPWEWILIEGKDPVAFGDCPDRETAERQLAEAVRDFCPDFEAPTIPNRPGLLTRLWRAL